MTSPLTNLFDNMDRWRHLPAYQLERRADIFFSAYLPGVIESHTDTPVSPIVVPEFPVRRDLIWPEKSSLASLKVDYLVFAEDRSKAFFVELKTDLKSREARQDHMLAQAPSVGFRRIVEGVIDITKATQAHQKYGHLLHLLAELRCVSLPDRFDDQLWPEPRRGRSSALEDVTVTVTEEEFAVEVIYVQPRRHEGDNCVDFEEFASHVEAHDDPVSARFARSLRDWVPAAGTPRP